LPPTERAKNEMVLSVNAGELICNNWFIYEGPKAKELFMYKQWLFWPAIENPKSGKHWASDNHEYDRNGPKQVCYV
jgi:hypothetical protein